MRTDVPPRSVFVLAALALSLAAAAAWMSAARAARGSAAGVHGAPLPADGTTRSDLELAAVDLGHGDRRAVGLRPAVAVPALRTDDRDPSKLLPPGKLVVRAVDTESGVQLRAPRVRVVSAARFADRAASDDLGERVVHLTPDEYVVNVAYPGHEPAELGPVSVLTDETTALEPVRLRAGSGRVAGRVAGVVGDDLSVGIFGEGRGRCGPSCAEMCERCGWSRDRTRLALGATGEFAFDRLASGAYLVRLVDGDNREAGTPQRLDLAADETRRVDLRVARARTLLVALDDVDGAPLDRIWQQRCARTSPYRVAATTVPALSWSAQFLDGEVLLAEGEFTPPDPTGTAQRIETGSRRCGLTEPWTRDDRARGADDALQPPVAVPRVDPAFLDADVGSDGVVQFEGVPARAKFVTLRCGPYRAAVPIRGGHGSVRRVRIQCDPDAAGATMTYVAFEAARSF